MTACWYTCGVSVGGFGTSLFTLKGDKIIVHSYFLYCLSVIMFNKLQMTPHGGVYVGALCILTSCIASLL